LRDPHFPVTLAVIIGAHGVTGEVRLKIFAENLASLKAHKAFNAGQLTLTALRDGPNGAIARFTEIADRNAAEAVRGTELTVARSALPALAPGEYYHADLIGLACLASDGTPIGTCIAVDNFGAGDVLEIERTSEGDKKSKRFMVPMIPSAVPEWGETITLDTEFIASL
jgi:16S rRNA processing protein RimM